MDEKIFEFNPKETISIIKEMNSIVSLGEKLNELMNELSLNRNFASKYNSIDVNKNLNSDAEEPVSKKNQSNTNNNPDNNNNNNPESNPNNSNSIVQSKILIFEEIFEIFNKELEDFINSNENYKFFNDLLFKTIDSNNGSFCSYCLAKKVYKP